MNPLTVLLLATAGAVLLAKAPIAWAGLLAVAAATGIAWEIDL